MKEPKACKGCGIPIKKDNKERVVLEYFGLSKPGEKKGVRHFELKRDYYHDQECFLAKVKG